MEAPNKAHKLIHGRLIKKAERPIKRIAINIFSSLGKNAVAAIVAIVQAFGLTH